MVICIHLRTLLLLILLIGPLDAASLPEVISASDAPCDGEPYERVLHGLIAFPAPRRLSLESNGRACADCHAPIDAFQHSPANAEALAEPSLDCGDCIRAPK